jgi:hypothetical protein
MDKAPPKIDQLVAVAKAELKHLGIDTEGKRSDELLNMAREQRNHPARRDPNQNEPASQTPTRSEPVGQAHDRYSVGLGREPRWPTTR